MNTLFRFATGTIQHTWTLLATHPVVTIPVAVVLVGTMVIIDRKGRIN